MSSEAIDMRFSDLPIELVYQIAEYLYFERDINALVRTEKRCYSALNSYLYRHNVKHWSGEALISVCEYGLSTSMRMFLNEGIPLDAYDHGWISLAVAAKNGHDDVVKCLLEEGVDPDPDGKVVFKKPWRLELLGVDSGPLDLAVAYGHERTTRLLVPHVESVDCFVREDADDDIKTPLTSAAENGDLNLVRFLIEEVECNAERVWLQGTDQLVWVELTPLANAVSCGHTDVVRYLLSNWTCPNSITKAYRTEILGDAVRLNRVDTAKTLIEHGFNPDPLVEIQQARTMFQGEANLDTYIEDFKRSISPLINAAAYGKHEMVKLLFQYIDLERVRDCDIEDANFLVPVAAACGLDRIVQRLLEKGCDVNTCFQYPTRTVKTGNALSFASKFGHIGVARILLDYGTDPNTLDVPWPYRPPVTAVDAGHQQMAELLLDAGANPNTADEENDHILIMAVQSEPIFRMLLNRGADPSALKPAARERLFQNALTSQNVSIMKMLLNTQYGLSIVKDHESFEFVMDEIARTDTAMFEYVMEYLWHQHGLKPGPHSHDWYLALESAIRRHNAAVVEIILQRYGLELKSENAVDYLAWAADSPSFDEDHKVIKAETTLEVLQRHGADINAKRSDGHTCLSMLIVDDSFQVMPGAKLLIERGAKYPLTYQDDSGDCLLTVVINTGYGAVLLELLLELIDAQGISSKDIEPHLQEAEAEIGSRYYDTVRRLKLEWLLQGFRCRRRYPVPD